MTYENSKKFVWRIRAVFSMNFDQDGDIILWLQNSIDQAVS